MDDYRAGGADELYVPLKFEWQVDPDKQSKKVVSAGEINAQVGSQYSFRQTVFAIQKGMADVLKTLIAKRTRE